MINEENTIFKRNPGVQVAGGGNPRPAGPAWLDYPADPLQAGWGPMD